MDIEALEKLANLKEKGLITQEEFETQKQKLFKNASPTKSNTSSCRSKVEKSVLDYFVECITTKYFCFDGRARRKEYWSFILFYILILAIPAYLILNATNIRSAYFISYISTIIILIFTIPTISVSVRRLHDINYPTWIVFLYIPYILYSYCKLSPLIYHIRISTEFEMIAMISGVIGLWISYYESDMKTNKYGPIPDGVMNDKEQAEVNEYNNHKLYYQPDNKSILKYIKECFTHKYCMFKGRAGRKEFWSYMLIVLPIFVLLLIGVLNNKKYYDILSVVLGVCLLLPTSGVMVRRLHDINYTGWLLLGFLLPISHLIIPVMSDDLEKVRMLVEVGGCLIGVFALIIMILYEGDTKSNKYGKGPE